MLCVISNEMPYGTSLVIVNSVFRTTVSCFETVFVLSCDFIYCNLSRKAIYWGRRHVGSGSYKEGGCKEKKRG